MDLFALKAKISIVIDDALKGLEKVGDKANKVADGLEEGVGGDNEVNIEVDKAQRHLGKAEKSVDDLDKAIDDLEDNAKSSSGGILGAFEKIGSGFGKVIKGVGLAVGAGVGALATLTAKSVSAAGDLEQNLGGSEAVFKDYANKIQETAKTAFSSMGLSQTEFLATANKMGALFQGAGFSIEESADLSSQAMQRAADVASIMGIDMASAMESIAGAAKGNFTMMDNLGVAMNETTLANYALEKGMAKAYDEMTQQEKIGVAMEMFLDRTAYATGNYAKENETLAGAMQTAKGAFSNFIAGVGSVEDVVSSATNAGEVIIKNVVELFPKLTEGLVQILNSLMPMIPTLLQQLLPSLIEGATLLINGLVNAMPQIISVLTSALPSLIQGITQIVNALIIALPQIMTSLVQALPTLIPMLVDGLVSMIVTLCQNIAPIIQPLVAALPDILVSIVGALLDNLPILIEGICQMVFGLIEAMPSIIQAFIDYYPKMFKTIKEGLEKAFPIIKESVINLFKNMFKATSSESGSELSKLQNKFSETFDKIKSKASEKWKQIKDSITKPLKEAKDKIKGYVDNIKDFFANFTTKIKLPKFTIKNASLNPKDWIEKGLPKLSVEWHKDGGIFTKPTLFDYDFESNTAHVTGEAGAEAMIRIDVLKDYIADVVKAENQGLNYNMERLYKLLVNYMPMLLQAQNKPLVLDSGVLVGELTPMIDEMLGDIATGKGRGR